MALMKWMRIFIWLRAAVEHCCCEKIVAAQSDKLIIVADESKAVPDSRSFPDYLWSVPFAHEWTMKKVAAGGNRRAAGELEKSGRRPVYYLITVTFAIADCSYGQIKEAGSLAAILNAIPGVVDNGLFVGMADQVIIAAADGQRFASEIELLKRVDGYKALVILTVPYN